jgi:hypothetical protein
MVCGDHLHRGRHERPYHFVDVETLQEDFWSNVQSVMETKK